MGGLALPDILRAQAQAGSSSHKAIIMIFLPGGPPHQDMYDIKTEAPSEIRGEFKPIRTNVPGIHICELLPPHGRDDGQIGDDSVHRGFGRQPQFLSVYDQSRASESATRRVAVPGSGVIKTPGTDRPCPTPVRGSSSQNGPQGLV